MKHITRSVLVAALVAIASITPACKNAEQQQRTVSTVVKLADIGLNLAVASGKVKPGTAILIKDVGTVLLDAATPQEKEVPASSVGLTNAIATGALTPGSTVTVGTTTATVTEIVPIASGQPQPSLLLP